MNACRFLSAAAVALLLRGGILAAAPTLAAVPDAPPPETGARPADPKELLKDPAFQEKLKRWRAMSNEERERLLARYEQWKKLPDWQRDCMKMNWSKFRSLASDQQAAAQKWFRQLPEDHRKKLVKYASRAYSFARMHQIPLAQFTSWVRGVSKDELDRIRQLPAEERDEALRKLIRRFYEHVAKKVEAQLPEGEREAFRKLSLDEMLARVRKWYADRKAQEAEKRGQFPWWERWGPVQAPGRGRAPRGERPPEGGHKSAPEPLDPPRNTQTPAPPSGIDEKRP